MWAQMKLHMLIFKILACTVMWEILAKEPYFCLARIHLKQQRKDITGTGCVNITRIFRPSLLSLQFVLSVLKNCKIWSSLNDALCSGYMRCKHLKFCWSTSLEDWYQSNIFLQKFYMGKICFDKPEPLCRHISLAVTFHLAKRRKRKSVLWGHSANQVLSILFKPPGLNFQLEMRSGFAVSWY